MVAGYSDDWPTVSEIASWTCPTCRTAVTTPFCARCGEAPLAPRDLSLRGLAEKLAYALTHIDARALRSVRCLLRHPGELTLSWTRGVRKPYVAPFQLFLVANVIFFAVQWMTGDNVVSSSLDSHLHHQDWSALAQSLVAQRLEATHMPFEQFAAAFDRAVVLHAKSLIILMAIPFAALLPLVLFSAHRPFMAHVVFALHLYTFILLLLCVALLLGKVSALLGFGGLEMPLVDDVLTVFNVMACAWYLYMAIGPVYGASGAARVIQAVVLSVAVVTIIVGYRFVIFLITLYTT